MISSIIETFKKELEKEETQETISNFLEPFLSKYRFYFYIVITILVIIATSSTVSAYILFKNQL